MLGKDPSQLTVVFFSLNCYRGFQPFQRPQKIVHEGLSPSRPHHFRVEDHIAYPGHIFKDDHREDALLEVSALLPSKANS